MRKGAGPVELDELIRTVQRKTAQDSPLDRVAVAVKYGEILKALDDELIGHFVAEARSAGCSWAQIGRHLGVTKQAAQQRHTIRRLFAGRRGRSGGRAGPLHRFNEEGRRVMVSAQEEGRRLSHNYLGTEHLLLGLLRDRQGRAARALRDLGLSTQSVRSKIKRIIGEGTEPAVGPIPLTPRTKKVLALAVDAAATSGDAAAAPEHILVGILDEGEGVAAQILHDEGITRRKVQEALGK